MLSKPKAVPKPEARKKTKARQQRADAKRAKTFRFAVWIRDGSHCRHCGQELWNREFIPGLTGDLVGHVHHLRGRNVAPEDRYNPDKAVLLCARCHRAVHDGRIVLS